MHSLVSNERIHRHTKFTPENIRRITDLVEQGKSRKDIAEVLGVTPGTLAVTCSRLKVSLRRPRASSGAEWAQRHRSIGERRWAEPNRRGSQESSPESRVVPRRTALQLDEIQVDDLRSANLAI